MAFGVEYKLKLQTVRVCEKDRIVVRRIIHRRRIENRRADLLKHAVQTIHLVRTGRAEREMMQARRVAKPLVYLFSLADRDLLGLREIRFAPGQDQCGAGRESYCD